MALQPVLYPVLYPLAAVLGSPATGTQGLAYDVFDRKDRIGAMVVTNRAQGSDSHEVTIDIRLQVDVLSVTVFAFHSNQKMAFDSSGLHSFSSHNETEGNTIDVTGRRSGRQWELTVLEAEDGRRKPKRSTLLIPRSSFDFSSAISPVWFLDAPGQAMAFRVFDLGRLEVVGRTFTWIKDERVMVGSKEVDCRVVDAHGPHSKSRRWYVKDRLHTLAKEEGVDENGPFRVILREYNHAAR